MTLTLTIVSSVLGALVVGLAGVLFSSWWRRRETSAQARLNLFEQEALRRGQLVVALALMLQDKGKPVRVPKATMERSVSWSITPQRRPDGGVDLPLVDMRVPKKKPAG